MAREQEMRWKTWKSASRETGTSISDMKLMSE
jgi:hypothetical protein